jgi:chromatin segregation and condensation protein Rec8/ScpA/Scc1 (kleisin family)
MITLAERTAVIRAALSGSDTVVLQELLGGMHDRVVAAVTFLAMLELCKRREITLEQAEPWGPIVARRVTERVERESEIDESLESFA